MLKLVCLVLKEIEIEWQYDQKEMKLKCRTKVDDEKLVDDDKFIEDFIRQQFLKFYIYINKSVKSTPNQSSSSRKKHSSTAHSKGSNHSSNEFSSANDSYLLNMYL